MTRTEAPTIEGLTLTWREFSTEQGVGFGLWSLLDPDATLDLLTDEEFQSTDERMPYFGHIWASAEALVSSILGGPTLEGKRVLDLGCGLGACGFAAQRRGADVTFFDWEPRALAIVGATAAQPPSRPNVHFVVGDWRVPPPLGRFDVILAADVLYEARNGPAVASFIADHLEVGGQAWISDPGRLHAGTFPQLAGRAGLAVQVREALPHPDPATKITCWRLARQLETALLS